MAEVKVSLPFESYNGDQPFAFVSYAHKDGKAVYAELKWLHNARYRIWYDEGIDPGNEWSDEIACALDRACVYLVFISKNALDSRNVRNEIAYAIEECKRNSEKLFIAIHLEEVEIAGGNRLEMGTIQAILKWRMSEEGFVRKVTKVLPEALKYGEAELTEQPVREDLGGTSSGPEWGGGR